MEKISTYFKERKKRLKESEPVKTLEKEYNVRKLSYNPKMRFDSEEVHLSNYIASRYKIPGDCRDVIFKAYEIEKDGKKALVLWPLD